MVDLGDTESMVAISLLGPVLQNPALRKMQETAQSHIHFRQKSLKMYCIKGRKSRESTTQTKLARQADHRGRSREAGKGK